MSAKRSLVFILCLFQCLQHGALYAQDKSTFPFGKVAPADFVLPSNPIINNSCHAVMIAKVGNIHFVGNAHGWFSSVCKKQVRIKIIDQEGVKLVKESIPLYKESEGVEKLAGVEITTYNLENGRVVETKLGKDEIFKTVRDKDWTDMSFTAPAVKVGSLVEYTYAVVSRYVRSLPDWEFQSENYPTLLSELAVEIPQMLTYAVVRQGIHQFIIDHGSAGAQGYRIVEKADVVGTGTVEQSVNVSANTIKHHWIMKDIPAFQVENYISAPGNYIDKLQFQLAKTNLRWGGKKR